ncbi:hypothetical protein GE061_009473 [Apolygus lucorum]|uniref:Uncharacterized protein n=1 Tax=Apolygus lucorum TaxID=248454 RepID=A0A8S9Y094_APOLU|nr:hypothetical protein GE061_009473 [Apolygus lucorum]
MPHVCVKGNPDGSDCQVFGLSLQDTRTIQNELALWGQKVGQDGIFSTLLTVSQLVSPISTPLTTPQLQADRRVPQVPAPQVTPPLQPNQNLVYPVIGSQATQPLQPVDSRQVYPTANPQPQPPVQVIGRPFVVQPPMTRAPTKQVERIGTKPEDWQEVPEVPDRIAAKHISSLEKIDPNQKIILKTNLSSEFNPLSKRPGPNIGYCEDVTQRFRKRSYSLPPSSRFYSPQPYRIICTPPIATPPAIERSYSEDGDDEWAYNPRNYRCYRVERTNVEKRTPLRREGCKIFYEDVYSYEKDTFTDRKVLSKNRRDLYKALFTPLGPKQIGVDRNCGDGITFFEKKGAGDVSVQNASNVEHQRCVKKATSNMSCPKSGAKKSPYSDPISCSTAPCPTFTIEDEYNSSVRTYPEQRLTYDIQDFGLKSDSNTELLPIIPSDYSTATRTENLTKNHSKVLSNIEQSVEIINDSCGFLMEAENLDDTQSLQSKDGRKYKQVYQCSPTGRYYPHRPEIITDNSEASTNPVKGVPTTPGVSYPDLTSTDLSGRNTDNKHVFRSEDSSNPNTYSSRTCRHGYTLSNLAYTENTYHVLNHISRARPPSPCEHKNNICVSSRAPSEPTKQQNCRLLSDTSCNGQPLSSSLGVLRMLLKDKADTEKLDELDETEWSMISSLVDEIFKNKRKRRKL